MNNLANKILVRFKKKRTIKLIKGHVTNTVSFCEHLDFYRINM